jgi:hypothetical protein
MLSDLGDKISPTPSCVKPRLLRIEREVDRVAESINDTEKTLDERAIRGGLEDHFNSRPR